MRPPFKRRTPAQQTPTTPPGPPSSIWGLLRILVPIVAAVLGGGGALAVLLDRTDKCKDTSQAAIDSQHRLTTEIVQRREAFVEAVTNAGSMAVLRDFPNHRDELHGYVFKEFADRSLADLEDTQIWSSRNMDEPNTLG